MCGIVGIFDLNGPSEIDRELLTQMNQVLFHRGPDEGDIIPTLVWAWGTGACRLLT